MKRSDKGIASLKREIAEATKPGSHEAMLIEGLVRQLFGAAHNEQPHAVFLDLCHLCVEAYQEIDPTDDLSLISHPATPVLMRYLLRALAVYAAEVEGAQLRGLKKSRDRMSVLADAFRLVGPGNFGKWNPALKMQILEAFSGAFSQARDAEGLDEPAAFERGLDAAYKAERQGKEEQDPRERRRTRSELRRLLRAEGYWVAASE